MLYVTACGLCCEGAVFTLSNTQEKGDSNSIPRGTSSNAEPLSTTSSGNDALKVCPILNTSLTGWR